MIGHGLTVTKWKGWLCLDIISMNLFYIKLLRLKIHRLELLRLKFLECIEEFGRIVWYLLEKFLKLVGRKILIMREVDDQQLY